jgi:hypothetical protein
MRRSTSYWFLEELPEDLVDELRLLGGQSMHVFKPATQSLMCGHSGRRRDGDRSPRAEFKNF